MGLNPSKKRRRMRMVIPSFAAFNIYSHIAGKTTALGPLCVATAVHAMEGWDVEVIDENNFSLYGPRNAQGDADHEFLQSRRPADVVGFYGGLTSTIPRLYALAKFYKAQGVVTIAGGQHFAGAAHHRAGCLAGNAGHGQCCLCAVRPGIA